MLNLPAPLSPPNPDVQDPAYFRVRVGWQQQGQPSQGIGDNATYILAEEIDDRYNRVRDVSYAQATDADGNTTQTQITNYTRVWEVLWASYGPDSFEAARLLRTRLFDQDVHDLFAQALLYLVTDPAAPRRVPEQKDGQWWERVDFSARFNEFVTETLVEGFATVSEVIIKNQQGIQIGDIELGGQ